jgi:polyhydroxyalkanoate synthase subunit PhaC
MYKSWIAVLEEEIRERIKNDFSRSKCKPDDTTCQLRNEDYIKNFLRMEKWIFDSPDQARETFRQFMKDATRRTFLLKMR